MQEQAKTQDRATSEELLTQINTVLKSDIFQGVLDMAGGIVCVINHQRQIVAVNDTFMKFLGIESPDEIFGLRPGEAVGCAYANTSPRGCGEGGYCKTCGAVEAVRISMKTGSVAERKVALRVKQTGGHLDMCLHLRAFPVMIGDEQFVVVFMQDISADEHRYELDKVFFHDILNSVSALISVADLMHMSSGADESLKYGVLVKRYSSNLLGDIRLQQHLVQGNHEPKLNLSAFSLTGLLKDILLQFSYHPAGQGMDIEFEATDRDVEIITDESMLTRLMMNMLINACEATEEEGSIKVFARPDGEGVRVGVWNGTAIPPDVSKRVFQKHYSTKNGRGRGYGTYSIKLIGEEYLKGRVGFSTSKEEGTTFYLDLPIPG